MSDNNLDLMVRIVRDWNKTVAEQIDSEVRQLRNAVYYARRDKENAEKAADDANIAFGRMLTDETGSYDTLRRIARDAGRIIPTKAG